MQAPFWTVGVGRRSTTLTSVQAMLRARLAVTLSVLVVGLVALSACSSSSDTNVAPPTTDSRVTTTTMTGAAPTNTTRPSLEPAVRLYTGAYLGGDAEVAYNLLSVRCKNETARNEFVNIVAQAHDAYGNKRITSYQDDVNGNVATATYELSDPTLNQTQERWVLEGGGWHNDDC